MEADDIQELAASPERRSPKRKKGEKGERDRVKFVCFVYDSDVNRDCMFNSIMNISQCSVYSRHNLEIIMPEGALDRNDGTEVTNERTLINVLTINGCMSGPNNRRLLPNDLEDDTRVNNYMRYFDKGYECNIPDFMNAISEAKFLILYFTLALFDSNALDYHFVPVLKFDEDWIIMGGERRSKMCSIHSDDLPNMLFSESGRRSIRDHCGKPFRHTAKVEFTDHAICMVPLHCGPRERMNYTGMTKDEVNRMIPWPILSNTSARLAKDHGFVIQMEQDPIVRLRLPNT